jgi:hypothetical protein
MRLEPIGDNLAIYSLNSRITLTQFVGSPLFFIFRQIATNIGIIGPNYFANFGPYHEFIAPADQYYFDGAQVKPNNSHVWREILRQEDPNRILGGYAHFDFLNADLQWVIPLTADTNAGPSLTWQEHYLENPGPGFETPYSKRTFPFTSTGYFFNASGLTWNLVTTQWQNTSFRWNDRAFAAQFPLNLAGDQNGFIYSLNVAQDANGVALPSFITFGRRAVGDGRVRGLVTRVYPFVTPLTTPINVTVQMSDSADGNPMIIDTKSFNQVQPEGGHFAVHYRRGRFFEVQFGSTGPSQPWEVKGYDTDIRPGGKR